MSKEQVLDESDLVAGRGDEVSEASKPSFARRS